MRAGRIPPDPGGVDAELAAVLRTSAARLFAEGALLREGSAPLGFLAPELVAPPASLDGWRASARELLSQLPADGALANRLRRLLREPAARWPRASRLARLARRVAATDYVRLVAAQVLLAEGDARRARTELGELIATDPPRDVLWRAFAGLGAAHESQGNDRLAGAAYWSAGSIGGVGAEPLVEGMFLALSLGEFGRASASVERLDAIAASDPAAMRGLSASLRRLGVRRELRAQAAPSGSVLALARRLAAQPSRPSAAVARVFLGGRP